MCCDACKEMRRKTLVIEGIISFWSNEGGYSASTIEVDGVSVEEPIALHLGVKTFEGIANSQGNICRVRITVEKLD